MARKANIITGSPLIESVCSALEMDPNNVARVVVDAKPYEPLAVYVELFGGLEMIDLVPPGVTAANVKIVGR